MNLENVNNAALEIEKAVSLMSSAAGCSLYEAERGIRLAIQKFSVTPSAINALGETFQDVIEKREAKRREEQWATDPLGLMEWLTIDRYRWLIFDAIHVVMGALNTLAEAIAPLD